MCGDALLGCVPVVHGNRAGRGFHQHALGGCGLSGYSHSPAYGEGAGVHGKGHIGHRAALVAHRDRDQPAGGVSGPGRFFGYGHTFDGEVRQAFVV